MRVGNYSVLIPEGTEKDTGHVGLQHGQQYVLRLGNHDNRQCDAEVTIDGKSMGGFRLYANQTMTLERSPEDNGRFTFYSSDTVEAEQAGEGSIQVQDKGLIQVRFVPERRRKPLQRKGGILRGGGVIGMRSMRSVGPSSQSVGPTPTSAEEKTSGGITGLSGHSNQQFRTVGALDRDESEAVTISIRLITRNDGPRPLAAVTRSNPVPAPV